MTKKDAKRYVLSCLADETFHHIANGSEWLSVGDDGKEFSEADYERCVEALKDLVSEFERRGGAR